MKANKRLPRTPPLISEPKPVIKQIGVPRECLFQQQRTILVKIRPLLKREERRTTRRQTREGELRTNKL